MSSPSSAPTEILTQRQHAFLLHQLASSPEGTLTQSILTKTTPTQIKQELQLNATTLKKLLAEMQEQGWITTEKHGRDITVKITEVGRQQLQTLSQFIPLQPAGGKLNIAPDERASQLRETYLLDQFQHAPKQTIVRSSLDAAFGGKPKLKVKELNKQHPEVIGFRDQHCLKLNAATTRHVLSELVHRGDVHVQRSADSESYTLTPQGVERLKALRSECPILPPTGKPTAAGKRQHKTRS